MTTFLDTMNPAIAVEDLRILIESARSGSEKLLMECVSWFRSVRMHAGSTIQQVEAELGAFQQEFAGRLESADEVWARDVIAHTPHEPIHLDIQNKRCVEPPQRNQALSDRYLALLLEGNRREASRLVMESFTNGVPLKELYLDVFQRSQRALGLLWQEHKISVAQEHFCTASTQLIMSQLYPYLFAGPRIGRSLVATAVHGDLHEVGIRIVSDFFELEGWDTYYLGADVPEASVISALRDRKAELLAISATMAYSLPSVEQLITAVRAEPATAHVRILVGGYPFTVDDSLFKKVGADATAYDAESAVELVKAGFDSWSR